MATLVAIALASQPAWGHRFPPVRTVVLQVEDCEVALLVGYRPGTGEPTEAILSRVAGQPKSLALDAMRSALTAFAMAPLVLSLDGKPLVPASAQAKIGVEPGGGRPMVVVLVTFKVPHAGALSITSRDPANTQISWTDLGSDRVDLREAPTQAHWFTGVASFLLTLTGPTGASACVSTKHSDSSR